MTKKAEQAEPAVTRPERADCPHRGGHMRADYTNRRAIARPSGDTRLDLTSRRRRNPDRDARLTPYRPEAEGRFALPRHESGLDVVSLVGRLRYAEHRSVPEIHARLAGRSVAIAERSVTDLLDRYDELLAVALADDARLKSVLAKQNRVIPAIDGLQPDVGHEVLWVIRDRIGGEIPLAKQPCSRHASKTSPNCSPRPATPARSRSPAWRPAGNTRSARRSRRCRRACRASPASSTTCVRRRGRFTRPTATPRRN